MGCFFATNTRFLSALGPFAVTVVFDVTAELAELPVEVLPSVDDVFPPDEFADEVLDVFPVDAVPPADVFFPLVEDELFVVLVVLEVPAELEVLPVVEFFPFDEVADEVPVELVAEGNVASHVSSLHSGVFVVGELPVFAESVFVVSVFAIFSFFPPCGSV